MASLIAKLWTRFSTKRAPFSIMIVGLDNSGKTSILNILASLDHGGSSSLTPLVDTSRESAESISISPCSSDSNIDKNSSSNNGSSAGNIMPTVGYNYERIQYKSLTITVLDFSGQNRYRNLWQEFYNGVDAIVFVIDSSDLIRLVVVRDELETMLSHPYFSTLVEHHNLDQHPQPLSPSATLTAQKQITLSQGKLIQTPLDTSLSSPSTIKIGILSQQKGLNKSHSRRRTKVPILFLANKTDLANSVDTEIIAKALNLDRLIGDRQPWFIQATSVNLRQGIVEGFDWLVSQLSVS